MNDASRSLSDPPMSPRALHTILEKDDRPSAISHPAV
jgi:hypothetical protein